jgi:hypothetical protein
MKQNVEKNDEFCCDIFSAEPYRMKDLQRLIDETCEGKPKAKPVVKIYRKVSILKYINVTLASPSEKCILFKPQVCPLRTVH